MMYRTAPFSTSLNDP